MKLSQREAIAKAATQGKWRWRDTYELRTLHGRGKYQYGNQVLRLDDFRDEAMIAEVDATHIAANSPAEVMRLIAQVREARAIARRLCSSRTGPNLVDAATIAEWEIGNE